MAKGKHRLRWREGYKPGSLFFDHTGDLQLVLDEPYQWITVATVNRPLAVGDEWGFKK